MKRFFDLFLSATLLIVIFPVLILISLLSAIFIGQPIFFTQDRPGLNGKVFKLIKFRTMKVDTINANAPAADKDRLTKYGIFLRDFSLDELPSLYNIIKGDMSFVGPRPLLVEYLPLYNKRHALRHSVKPGLTGWAQINGRNLLTWPEKFELDVWYVENHSWRLDLTILLLTFKKVLVRDGISSRDHVTMEKFKGNS